MKRKNPPGYKDADLSPEDAAVYEVMKSIRLKPGQMLLMGPRSIDLLLGRVDLEHSEGYVDKIIYERKIWNRG